MTQEDKFRQEHYTDQGSIVHSFFKKQKKKIRDDFFDIFKKFSNYDDETSFIDIGTTPSTSDDQNIFLKNLKNHKNVTCLSNQDCSILKEKFPNIKDFIISDGRSNNISENSYDIVHSNATLEHVGSFDNQLRFVKECVRISKKKIFIQTPNRFYPFDFHTNLPFLNLLPKKIHRILLSFFGKKFYSMEENLNLLSENDIIRICNNLNIKKYKIVKYKFLFFTSNLILLIDK